MKIITKDAIQDVIDGAKNYEFWMTFGMNDIKAKYRRSKLGQLWITLSVAIFIVMIGTLYGGFFGEPGDRYMSFLAVGYIVWLFISESVNVGCLAFSSAKPFIMQRNWPYSTFIFRIIYREVLIFLHLIVIIPPIFLVNQFIPSVLGVLVSIVGFALCAYTAFWVVLILAIICLRYRDMPPIVASLMRLAFFVTPILWAGKSFGGYSHLITILNPFGYFVNIVRMPLLGEEISVDTWIVSVTLSFIATIVGLIALTASKDKLAYWM